MKMKYAVWSGILVTAATANLALAAGPSDPQIAAIVVTANQVDIDAGKLAVAKSHTKDVKDFAQLMITDHSGVNKSATELVQKLHVTPESNPTSQSLQKGGDDNLAALKKLSGSAFDRAVATLADGRIIWYSERDNWGHLYLYDRQGGLIRQLTSGHWKVMRIARIDERRQRLYFVAVGREPDEDPYQRHLYAVNLDGSRLVDITPENGDHEIRIQTPDFLRVLRPGLPGPSEASLSPSGRYVVDTYSRPDAAPGREYVSTKIGRAHV